MILKALNVASTGPSMLVIKQFADLRTRQERRADEDPFIQFIIRKSAEMAKEPRGLGGPWQRRKR